MWEPTVVQVAYIAGCARSGSTLLTRLLGELPGFVPVGQAASHYFLSRSTNPEGDPPVACGCGVSMKECSLWSQVPVDPEARAAGRRFTRGRHLHRALFWEERKHEDLARFVASASNFYQQVSALTGAAVLVESSKNPVFAALLSRAPQIRVHVIHLIRDLHKVVGSWLRPKQQLGTRSARFTIAGWYWVNLESELVQHRVASYSRMRYEDFIAAPEFYIEQIGSRICGRPVRCDFVRDRVAQLSRQHLVGGNPDKWKHGAIVLQEPPNEIGPWLHAAVSIAGAPLLARYGYFSRDGGGRLIREAWAHEDGAASRL